MSSSLLQEDGLSPREQELKDLKESLQDTQPVGVLVDCCRTMDQVNSNSRCADNLITEGFMSMEIILNGILLQEE